MHPPAAIALFCDDIREEQSGVMSVIGIYPDNLRAPSFPLAFPRLGIYVRTVVDIDYDVQHLETTWNIPGVGEPIYNPLDRTLIEKSIAEARSKSAPTCTFITKITAVSLVVPEPGLMTVKVRLNEMEFLAGILKVGRRVQAAEDAHP